MANYHGFKLLLPLMVLKTVEWRILEVSGPNTPIATLGLLLDASAFWLEPKVLISFVRYCFINTNFKFIIVVLWNLLLGLTILPILLLAKFIPVLGRIAKFEEGGGKWQFLSFTAFSFDLSAATDRLPLKVAIFNW
jgi:hypothetical protein